MPLDSLPHNIEAEQALLGALLIDNRVYDRVSDIVRLEHFSDGLHARIWELAAELIHEGRQANPVTLLPYFRQSADIRHDLTVPQYLGRLAAGAVSINAAKDYATEIRDTAVKRSLIELGHQVTADAENPDLEPKAIIAETEGRLYQLAETSTYGRGSVSIRDVVNDCVERTQNAVRAGGRQTGLQTGFIDLDRKLGGLASGNLVILAGRPGMGKTALAINIATHVARRGTPVQFDSMEMSAEELGYRLLSDFTEIESDPIKTGVIYDPQRRPLNRAELDRIAQATLITRELPLWIDAQGGLKIGQLCARARRVKRQRNIGLLVIDYLQLMAGGSNNRVADVTEITTGLKALAKDLEIPIVALSQLSRNVENRPDKRPQLSDLRESGSIEQDADIVLFVYREDYYLEREEPDGSDLQAKAKWQAKLDKARGRAEVIVGKHRHGTTGIVTMQFDGRYTRFCDAARETPRETHQ